jgi:RNA polymerase sigma factor (sigma-70 family)
MGAVARSKQTTADRAREPSRLLAYLAPLLNFVRRRIRFHEALGDLPPGALRAEELVDAVFAEALAARAERPAQQGVYPWLRRLARQVLAREIERARQQRRERSLEAPLRPGPRADQEADGRPRRLIDILPDPSAPPPDTAAEQAEFQRALARLLGDLPEAWREPFLLTACDGYSVRRVATLEGLPVAEVRRRIALAREFLRARLAEEYEEFAGAAPTETLFTAVERIEPSAEHAARLRNRLSAAS